VLQTQFGDIKQKYEAKIKYIRLYVTWYHVLFFGVVIRCFRLLRWALCIVIKIFIRYNWLFFSMAQQSLVD